MKQIPLTQGEFSLVDDDDYDYLNQFKWMAFWNPNSGSFYALRQSSRRDGKRNHIRLHRVVTECPDGMDVDHINGDTLDNRKINLRVCTPSENRMNRGKTSANTSGYKGVYASRSRWVSRIGIKGDMLHIGVFKSKEDAARAYDKKAIEIHGEFANLNFPRSDYE